MLLMVKMSQQAGVGLGQNLICWGSLFWKLIWCCSWHFLVRYEIVYQYGGIYLDTDSKSLESFGPIFQESFVCYVSGYNTLDNSVFGMPVGSKFLRFVLESAKLNFQLEEFKKRIVYLRYGPTFLGKMFFKFNDERINIIDSRYLIFNYTNSNYMIQVLISNKNSFQHFHPSDEWSVLGRKKIKIFSKKCYNCLLAC